MDLLTLVTRVADEAGLPRPTAVATGTNQLERQYFALANATLEELAEKDWPVLTTDYTFNTVIGQVAYTLPADFKRRIQDTTYDAASYYQIRGSVTPQDWQARKNSLLLNTGRYNCRISGWPQTLQLVPTPQVVSAVVYEYITCKLVVNAALAEQELFTADTDVAKFPAELLRMGLKWRIKHAKGLDYAEDFNKYEARCKELLGQSNNFGSIPVAIRGYGDTPELSNGYVPDTGYGV